MTTLIVCVLILLAFCSGGPAPHLHFVHQERQPVLDSRATPGTEDNMFGFEGGRVIKENGAYYYFTAEMFRFPVDANMRVALWRASRMSGPWRRLSTIQQSNQSFPQVLFTQQCNQAYCPWQGATASRFRMRIEYACDPDDLLASPWAPFPLFDEAEDRWHVLYVGYMCDGTWMVSAGGGNIFGARSSVPGRRGIEGPYKTYGIVLGPNATEPAKRWGSISHTSPDYVDSIGAYPLDNGTFAAFIGESSSLAFAAHPAGPWHVTSAQTKAISTPSSSYNENPTVTKLTRPDGSSIFVAVFDTVYSETHGFGLSWSEDGLQWSPGVDVPLPGGCRTPLGLIDEGDGLASMLFTRRFADCDNQTALPTNGADAISPASCANVYSATFHVSWRIANKSSGLEGVRSALALAASSKAQHQRLHDLRARLIELDGERREVQRLLDEAEANLPDAPSSMWYL